MKTILFLSMMMTQIAFAEDVPKKEVNVAEVAKSIYGLIEGWSAGVLHTVGVRQTRMIRLIPFLLIRPVSLSNIKRLKLKPHSRHSFRQGLKLVASLFRFPKPFTGLSSKLLDIQFTNSI